MLKMTSPHPRTHSTITQAHAHTIYKHKHTMHTSPHILIYTHTHTHTHTCAFELESKPAWYFQLCLLRSELAGETCKFSLSLCSPLSSLSSFVPLLYTAETIHIQIYQSIHTTITIHGSPWMYYPVSLIPSSSPPPAFDCLQYSEKTTTCFSLQATKTRDGLFCILQAIKTGGEKPWEQGYHPANAIMNCSWDQRRTGVHKGTAGAYKSKFSSCRHAPKVVCYWFD